MVPRRWDRSKRLGEWVTDQRRQYKFKSVGKISLLTDDRQKKLDEICFTWSVRSRTEWSDRYQELLIFRGREGHCCVPQHFATNKALGKWVCKYTLHNSALHPVHPWQSVENLISLTLITFGLPTAKQREQYRYFVKGTHSFMTQERIQLLNKVDFIWSAKGKRVAGGGLELTLEQQQHADKVEIGLVVLGQKDNKDVTLI